jgi:pilus assembly protein Flp/PilA
MGEERRRGQAMVEYALILVLIAVVVIGVLLVLGGQIKSIFTSIYGALAGH